MRQINLDTSSYRNHARARIDAFVILLALELGPAWIFLLTPGQHSEDAAAHTLNDELLARLNSSGRAWAAPHSADSGELLLLQPMPALADGADSWAQVQAAAEKVMLGHFGGYFCGACDCIDVLAGQVLT